MWQSPASELWYNQHSPPMAPCPHYEVAPYRELDVTDNTRTPSYYESSRQPAFISPRDPARNQHPSSSNFGPFSLAQLGGSHVQSRLSRGGQPVTFPPHGPLRVAPGGNPHGNQKPGPNTGHSLRHGSHVQGRISGPYSSHIVLRHQNVRYQQESLHSYSPQQQPGVPSWPAPSMTHDYRSLYPQLTQLDWQWQAPAAVPAQPQGSHINEVTPSMPVSSAPVVLLETTSPVFGTQPADDSAPYTESSSSVPQSTTGACPDPTCLSDRTWGRQQELERHVLKHLPPHIYCPHSDCFWRGSRRYALAEHYERKHPEDTVPPPEMSTIYDAKPLAKRLVNREITMAEATDEARKVGYVPVRRTTM